MTHQFPSVLYIRYIVYFTDDCEHGHTLCWIDFNSYII